MEGEQMSKSEFMNGLRNEALEKDTGGADVKEYFDVILCDVGTSKIEVVRVVKEITGLGLKEVKALVDAAPVAIRKRVSEAQAIADKCRLESVGATVELK